MLRRTMSDPMKSDIDRLAALKILADATASGFVDQRHRYGTARRGSDEGFVKPDHRASPSQATTYDACPRQYALDRFATQGTTESVYLTLGNLIHTVLETVEATAVAAGRERSTIREALESLDSEWNDTLFGTGPVAEAWKRRSEKVLRHLYDKWPSGGVAVATEAEVEIDLDDTTWAGKIDRVERLGDALKVVDYKTSNTVPNVTEAKESLQLGFYVLAARSVPELAGLGTVESAEFWFPSPPPNKNAIKTRRFAMDQLDEVRGRLVEVAHGIRGEQFDPTPHDRCDRCEFAQVCPAQPDGVEAFQT